MLSEIQGQDEALRFLQRVLLGHITSPLLLAGPVGVGKQFSVACLAREMFCTGSKTVDCDCIHCEQLKAGVHPDYFSYASEDDKDIGIEVARSIVEEAECYPSLARFKIVLINDADRLTGPAANALLKTLEEPPRTLRFFLTAARMDRVLHTIRSRMGVVRYRRLPDSMIVSKLSRFEQSASRAALYARLGDGSLGQAIQFWGARRVKLRDQMLELLNVCLSGDLVRIFSIIDELGDDVLLGLRFLSMILSDLLIIPHGDAKLVNGDVPEKIRDISKALDSPLVFRLWQGLRDLILKGETTNFHLSFALKALLAQLFVRVGSTT
jgi:DNA polymerase-3 subunit delta'